MNYDPADDGGWEALCFEGGVAIGSECEQLLKPIFDKDFGREYDWEKIMDRILEMGGTIQGVLTAKSVMRFIKRHKEFLREDDEIED